MAALRGGIALVICCLSRSVLAAVQTLEWNVTYTTANPDGLQERRVIGVNGKWPPPQIDLNYGDRLVLTVNNQLDDVTTGLHAHGLYQNGSNYFDGPIGVTQCGIPPGESLTYNYTVEQNGTYWIHSHLMGQYPDGLRSPFIIHDPDEPYTYDDEFVISFSDWYHDEVPVLIPTFMSLNNPTGAEPIPDSALMNDQQNATIHFEAGKTYRLRLVNMAAFAMFHFWIEDHDMTVIELDGVYVEPYIVPGVSITTAQRVSVLVTAKNSTTQNYAMVGAMDTDMFDYVPDNLNPNVTSWIVYNSNNSNPTPELADAFYDWDETSMTPLEPEPLVPYDQYIQLDVLFDTLGNGVNYAMFNQISYTAPIVPSLLTVLSSPTNYTTDPTIYGNYTNPEVLGHNNVVQVVLNNGDTGKHPFHLHGHTFQVVYRSEENAGMYNESMTLNFTANPIRRDTIQVKPLGFLVLRFVANNPGIWLFHCHIEWHVIAGLTSTFIEAPLQIQERMQFPDVMLRQCQSQHIPVTGNAANHSDSDGGWLNLAGEPAPPSPLPSGFTAKGYGAMAGCVIAAVIGMGTIIWYGLTEATKDYSLHGEPVIIPVFLMGNRPEEGDHPEAAVPSEEDIRPAEEIRPATAT